MTDPVTTPVETPETVKSEIPWKPIWMSLLAGAAAATTAVVIHNLVSPDKKADEADEADNN
jgi:hypothetical protein